MDKSDNGNYNYIPLAGEDKLLTPIEEIMKRYEKIIYDLFVAMLSVEIYLLLSHMWAFSVLAGILFFGAYYYTKKEIKEIRQLYENSPIP